MEIIVYNRNLIRIGVIDEFSLIWTRKYFEPGNFELHTVLTNENIKLLSKENIVAKRNSVEAGVIEDITYDDSSKNLIVKGRFLSSYLDRRLVKSTFSFNGFTEVGMRNLINNVELIPNLRLGNINNFGERSSFQATMKELLSLEVKLAKASGLGFRVKPDFTNKCMYFEVYKGTDRSKSQSFNDRVIFSEDYDNLNNLSYKFNNQLSKTKAIVGGKGEGSSRVFVDVGGGVGLDLKEIFVDAKDIDDTKYTTHDEYLDALRQRGYERLSSLKDSEIYEYETVSDINFVYKRDYDLGDIVTIERKEYGINLNKRITEIQEIYENGGMTIIPTLGSPISESVDWSNLM